MTTAEAVGGEAGVLDAVGYDPVTTDQVAVRTRLAIERVLSTLLHLELAGSIEPLPGGRFQRVS